MKGRFGFTLIELLIVVAIIGILSSLAMVNFLQAQIRAKVARAEADMYSTKLGIEMYSVDNNRYPAAAPGGTLINDARQRLVPITTPVDYLSSVPTDIFELGEGADCNCGCGTCKDQLGYLYHDFDTTSELDIYKPYWEGNGEGRKWALRSVGPTKKWDNVDFAVYDPTNGTISKGAVWTTGP